MHACGYIYTPLETMTLTLFETEDRTKQIKAKETRLKCELDKLKLYLVLVDVC